MGQAGLPVIVVAGEHALAARGETLELERAGAVRLGDDETDRHDVQVVPVGQLVDETPVRRLHRHLHRQGVELLQPVEVDRAERRGAGERFLRVENPPKREDNVVGTERLAVMEFDAGLQSDDPLGGRALRRDLLRQHVLALGLIVQLQERLVQLLGPGRVEIGETLVRVQGVRARSPGEPHRKVAPLADRRRRRRRRGRGGRCRRARPARREQPAARRKRAGGKCPVQEAPPAERLVSVP